jgi:carboxypeptidase family protein
MELRGRLPRPGDMRRPQHGAVGFILILGLGLAACATLPGSSPQPLTPTDAARIALAQDARFTGIVPRDESLVGQAAWYQVSAAADGWRVVIRIGWGDCPAGCINEHRWTYSVASGGGVQLVDETGDTLPDGTGLHGTVTAGPTCPVETVPPDPACAERPVAGAVLVLSDANGGEVARATSAADGTFSVEVAPGTYHLTAQPVEGLMGVPEPMDVTVDAGVSTELQLSYDTGIR